MKYNININQKAIVDAGLDLDMKDAAILDWLRDFINSGNCKTLVDDGVIYYWISYSHIINDMPLLRVKGKDIVYRRIKNLIEQKIITPYRRNSALQRTFFTPGENWETIFFSTDGKKTELPKSDGKINRPKAQKRTVKKTANHSTSKNNHNTIKEKKEKEPTAYFKDKKLNAKFIEWIAHRKEIRKRLTPTTMKAQIKLLHKFETASIAIDVIDYSITGGYQGLFPPKKSKDGNGNATAHHKLEKQDYSKSQF